MSGIRETPQSVTVEVPATSANLGPGFDSFGLALDLTDEVTLACDATAEADVIDITGECADSLPRDESHLILRTARRYLAQRACDPGPLRLTTHNRIPHGRGLGSSAAAVVAALRAASALAGDDPDLDLLPSAAEIEGHPDNVAPCLHGGLTVSFRDDEATPDPDRPAYRCVSVRPHPDLVVSIALPETELPTALARGMLPTAVPLADAAANSARAALLLRAFTTDPDLLLPATRDYLHQSYRAAAYPDTFRLVTELRARSVAAAVSGAGPAVLLLSTGDPVDQPTVDSVAGPGIFRVIHTSVSQEGARVRTAPHRAP